MSTNKLFSRTFLCVLAGSALAFSTGAETAVSPAELLKSAKAVDVVTPAKDESELRKQITALHTREAYGDRSAAGLLAEWKRKGVGKEAFYLNTIKLEKLANERNDPELWVHLGLAKVRGEGGQTPDIPGGIALLEKGRSAGSISALVNLGALYMQGDSNSGMPVDIAKARVYYEELEKRGDPRGSLELGLIELNHDKNPIKAAVSFEKAGDGGLPHGYFRAGKLLGESSKNPAERRRAFAMIEKAAVKGHQGALIDAGITYIERANNDPKEIDRGVELLTKALESGHFRTAQRVEALFRVKEGAEESRMSQEEKRLERMRCDTFEQIKGKRDHCSKSARFVQLIERVRAEQQKSKPAN